MVQQEMWLKQGPGDPCWGQRNCGLGIPTEVTGDSNPDYTLL